MSSIPTNAMPRAGEINQTEGQSQGFETAETSESTGAFGQIADKAREYPKTAIAAGAAVAAGVVAAATLTARSRGGDKNDRSNKGNKKD